MGKKSDKRGQIPRMRDLSITEQDALIQRWRLRKDLRTAYPEIVGAMMLWVIDSYDIAQFVAIGHESHFDINPRDDLAYRMMVNGFTDDEIQAAVDGSEVAADWMTQEELASVIERITRMKKYFQTHAPGTFAQALIMYIKIGQAARRKFIQQYGYDPEDSAVPRVRITGEDKEQKKLQPDNHQPPLF